MKKRSLKMFLSMISVFIISIVLMISASAALGDLNNDGSISASDARLILRISAKLETVTDEIISLADINSDGKVSSADARIALRVSAKIERIETYIPADINAEITYSITDDGFFIGGESTATISITPDADCSGAVVQIVDSAQKVVYTYELKNLVKDTASTFEWNGTGKDGSYVSSGDYQIVATINESVSSAEGLNFTKTNYFSGGNGSENNPFLVGSIAKFENIVRYPTAHFKQTNDFDYEYSSAKSMFTKDAQFNGVYDGNGKTFKNLLSGNSLFDYVGETGEIRNVNIVDSSFSSYGALVRNNYGKILDCEIDANVTRTSDSTLYIGIICSKNYGLIMNCTVSGAIAGTETKANTEIRVGGVAGVNSGKIVNTVSNVNVSGTTQTADGYANTYVGGIAGDNLSGGFIQNCEATGSVYSRQPNDRAKSGGIVGNNEGQIINCIYTGESTVNLAGLGSGLVS